MKRDKPLTRDEILHEQARIDVTETRLLKWTVILMGVVLLTEVAAVIFVLTGVIP
jgi:hypothetical protein